MQHAEAEGGSNQRGQTGNALRAKRIERVDSSGIEPALKAEMLPMPISLTRWRWPRSGRLAQ